MAHLPVTAVSFLLRETSQFEGGRKNEAPLVAAGVGRCIEVWTTNGQCIHRLEVLPDGPVSGIVPMKDFIFTYGHNRHYACVSNNLRDVVSRGRVTDRILTVYEDLFDRSILLVLAHGQVLRLCSRAREIRGRFSPAHDALVYSACVIECTKERIVIAMGTVFNGIEVVQVDREGSVMKLLGTLGGPEGHKGSIFALTHCKKTHMLASASDDRTIRVWNLEQLVPEDPPNFSIPLATFHGHRSRIWDVLIDPSSTRILSAGEDGTLRSWSIPGNRAEESHKETIFGDHQGSVRCLDALELDGDIWVVSGGDDCSLSLRKLALNSAVSREPVKVELATSMHGDPKAVEIMPNNELVTVLADGTIFGMNVDVDKEAVARNATTCLFDNTLLVGTLAGHVFLLEREVGRTVKLELPFQRQITHIAGWNRPDTNETIVLAQAGDGSVAMAKATSTRLNIQPIEMQSTVICSSLLFDASKMVLGTRDGRILLLDIETCQLTLLKRICTDAITCIKRDDSTGILVTDRSGRLSNFTLELAADDTPKLELRWQHRLTKGWLEQVDHCSEACSYLVAGFRSTTFFLLRVSGGQCCKVFTIVTGGAHRTWRLRVWEHGDRFTFVFVRLGKLYRYDGNINGCDNEKPWTIKKAFHSDSIRCIAALTSNVLATGGEDGWIKLSNVSNDGQIKVVGSFRLQASSNVKCIVAWRDQYVFTGGSDEELCGWKITAATTISPFWRPVPHATDGIRIMDMDITQSAIDESLLLVLGLSNSQLNFYKLTKSGAPMDSCLRVPAHQGHCILQVKFLPPSETGGKNLLLSGGTDGLLQLRSLDLEDGHLSLVDQLQTHQSGVNVIAIHPKEPFIISGGDDGKVALITVEPSSSKMTLMAFVAEAHHSTVTGLCWVSRDRFFSVAVDQRVILWRIKTKLGEMQLEKERQMLTQVADAGAAIIWDRCLLIAGSGIEMIPIGDLE